MKSSLVFQLTLLTLATWVAGQGLSEKFRRLHSRSLSTPALKLDDASFDEITQSPRDYTALVLLTAMPAQFGCQLCREFQSEFDILSRSWVTGDKKGETRTLFGILDFPDGKSTFQKMTLQTAPVLFLYPPTTGPNAKADNQPIRLDFSQGPQSAEQVHAWLSRHLAEGAKPPIRRPFNYTRLATIVTLMLGGVSFITIAGPYLLPIVQNRNLWAAISLIIVLLFTSGHMFNHIRKVPYVAGDGKGGISYFAGGFSNQWGMETQIVAAMYGILAFATISLALKVPRIVDSKQQQIAVVFWGVVMLG
ncbi:oligosaccharyl transferase subunit ost3/OST6, partial [Thelotrema lepadinum]|nr:oligosaccharyl transferase subunit ost3/OST6 [Thelotrema lepadinum]